MSSSRKMESSSVLLLVRWFSVPLAFAVVAPFLNAANTPASQPQSAAGPPQITVSENKTVLPPTTPPKPALGASMPLRLKDAIAVTIQKNQNILIAQQQVAMARGQAQTSAGPFDPLIAAQLQSNRSSSGSASSNTTQTTSSIPGLSRTSGAQAGVRTLLRNGLTIAPQVTYSNEFEIEDGETWTDGSGIAGVTVGIPLLAGLGTNNQFASNERAAAVNVKASQAQLDFITSQQIYNTTSAYWNLLLAQTNVRIALSQEAGARRLIGITEALIQGYVEPAIQLAQAKANLEQYTSQRLSAELGQSVASQQLAVAMGYTPQELLAEPVAVDPFPDVPAEPMLQIEDIRRFMLLAMKLRPDVRAREDVIEANKILLAGYKNAALPTMNLSVGGGVQRGSLSTTYDSTTVSDTQNGLIVGAGLDFQYPFFNNAAEGQVAQQISELDQSRTQLSLTESQISSDVITAAKSVILNRKALDQAIKSAKNAQISVGAQEQLFAMGMASLVEVITTQTSLATAQLSVADNMTNYALALAALRFATGTLNADNFSAPLKDILIQQIKK